MTDALIGLGVMISPFVIGWPLVQGFFVSIHLARHGARGLAARSALTTLGWLLLSIVTAAFFFVTAMAHCCRTQVTITLLATMGVFLAVAILVSRWQARWFNATRLER